MCEAWSYVFHCVQLNKDLLCYVLQPFYYLTVYYLIHRWMWPLRPHLPAGTGAPSKTLAPWDPLPVLKRIGRYTILYVHIQANVNIHVYVVYMYLTVGWNRDLILDFLNFLKTHLKLDGYKGENGYTELKHRLCDPLSFWYLYTDCIQLQDFIVLSLRSLSFRSL